MVGRNAKKVMIGIEEKEAGSPESRASVKLAMKAWRRGAEGARGGVGWVSRPSQHMATPTKLSDVAAN